MRETGERDVETLADRLRRAFWDPDNGGQWEKIAAAVLTSDWYAVRIAQAEQRGREDNVDHGMCYVSGSKALAARDAESRREALTVAADDLEGRLGTEGAPRNLWEFRQWLRDRGASIRR